MGRTSAALEQLAAEAAAQARGEVIPRPRRPLDPLAGEPWEVRLRRWQIMAIASVRSVPYRTWKCRGWRRKLSRRQPRRPPCDARCPGCAGLWEQASAGIST